MSYLTEDPREQIEPPNLEDLYERMGEPVASLSLDDGEPKLPQGLLACCRVTHQPWCQHHVAGSLVACHYDILYLEEDGKVVQPKQRYRHFEGDILASPLQFAAALDVVRLMAQASAEAQGGKATDLRFDIWLFNLEQQEMFRYALSQRELQQREVLASLDGTPVEEIRPLPIVVLTEDEMTAEALAKRMSGANWKPVGSYAERMEVLPGEIGHDERARYLTSAVLGREGDSPPLISAIEGLVAANAEMAAGRLVPERI